LITKDNGDGTVTMRMAVTVGPISNSYPLGCAGDFEPDEWGDVEQDDALDAFYKTLSSEELQLIGDIAGVAELMKKAFQHGHAVVESWKDDSEKSKD
jgi:hypothetical protein